MIACVADALDQYLRVRGQAATQANSSLLHSCVKLVLKEEREKKESGENSLNLINSTPDKGKK